MRVGIVLVPGLSGKFDSPVLKIASDYAQSREIDCIKCNFTKYIKGKNSDSTFNEQVFELNNLIEDASKKYDKIIILARSLGNIPAILSNKKVEKILCSPPIEIGDEQDIFSHKFKNLESKPIVIDRKRISNNCTMLIGEKDNLADLHSIKNIKGCRVVLLKGQDHDLGGLILKRKVEQAIEDAID